MPTNTSKILGAKPSPGDGRWRSKGALAVAFVGVGALGIFIGRASSPAPERPASPAATPSASATPEPSISPQKFDLAEDPRASAGIALRPMDRDIFAVITNMELDRERMHDVFPDRPYRVALVGSIAERRIGLVMIDLDRDGKFEERWDLKRDGVTRVVQKDPAAGGNPVMYTLAHGRWQVH